MTDTTVKYFTSAMAGAPTLNNTAGALIAVLDACLVNGWGSQVASSVVIAGGVGTATLPSTPSAIEQGVVLFTGAAAPAALNGERKVTAVGANTIVFDATDLADGAATGTITVKAAPAGWVKAFTGTNLAAYKSANVQASGRLLRVDDTTTTYAGVRGYEAMSDINTGTGIFPMVSQQATNVWLKGDSATAKPWFIVANDRMVYVGVAPQAASPTQFVIYSFGDAASRKSVDAYRTVLFAATSTTVSAVVAYNPVPATSGTYHSKYAARSYAAIGSPVPLTQTWLQSSGFSGYNGLAFPNAPDNGILVAPISLLESTSVRGELPGILASPQAAGANIADGQLISGVSGYNRTLLYRQACQAAGVFGGVFFDLTGPWST